MERFLWICFAGAVGSGCRYLVSVWSAQRLGVAFPYGTFIVNASGCFLIAFILRLALGISSFPETLRIALTTGFLGGFTTYSSFNYETTRLFLEGKRLLAVANVGVTLLACLVCGVLGLVLASKLTQS